MPTEIALAKTMKGYGKDATDVELNYMEKSLYCYMKVKYDYFKSYKKDFFESQDSFVDFFGVSKKTIQRMTNNLVKAGLVSIRFTDRNNVYTVHDCVGVRVNPIAIKQEKLFDTNDDSDSIPF